MQIRIALAFFSFVITILSREYCSTEVVKDSQFKDSEQGVDGPRKSRRVHESTFGMSLASTDRYGFHSNLPALCVHLSSVLGN